MKQFYKFFFQPIKAKSFVKIATFGLACLLGSFQSLEAQVSAYSFTQSNGSYAPITGTVLGTATGNTSATNLNSEVYPITLPFGFNFNDVVYTSLNVSSNGFVTFGSTPPLTSTTVPISGTVAYNGAISAFGRDINSIFDVAGVTGNISWEVIGTAPNREIVIQWKDFRPTNITSTTAAYTFSFQIRLRETSNIIKAVYNNGSYLAGNTAYSSTVQVGLRGNSNLDFNNRLNATTTEFINSTAGTANTSVQNFNTSAAIPGMPTAGLTYTWTPPSCYVPSVLSQTSVTTNTANISWSATSSLPGNGYEVYYSTSSTAPTSSTVPQLVNINSTSAVLSSLTPSTVYYVWVRSNCGAGNMSIWSVQPLAIATLCQPPSLLSTSGATVCPNQTATLNATTVSGANIKWYDAATGGNLVGNGNSFVTPALNSTTNYYASASTVQMSTVGKTTIESNASTGGGIGSYLEFTAVSDFTLSTVDLFPYSSTAGTAGTVTIELRTSTGTPITSATVNVVGNNSVASSVPQTVTVNFPITAGTSYRLAASAWTGVTNLYRDAINITYPYSVPGVVNITGAYLGPTTVYYYFFYNWKILAGCESARTTVTATVDSNCLSTSEVDKKDEIKVYPNPFSEVVDINKPELVKTIRVSDISGKLIKTINQPESVLRLNDLSSGMYILQLDMKDGSKQTIKIIKK